MRRVVAEQIKALNELTDIVTRSGRSFDVAEPATAPRRAPEPARAPEYRQPEPRPVIAEPAAPPRAPEPAPRREEPKAVAETPAPMRREEPARPRPSSKTPAPVTAPTAPVSERRQGWLSDLLARASREDEPEAPRPVTPPPARSPSHTIESLDSISLDISRMIDHDASVELWDRYRRGERNVFTRRLYTTQGQQSFEEIRRRYRSDEEFRTTVDRYTQEFERLLNEVSRDDRDGLLTKTYLTSETGKVYTMLAHASGRLQ
jgi:hypothetical protein